MPPNPSTIQSPLWKIGDYSTYLGTPSQVSSIEHWFAEHESMRSGNIQFCQNDDWVLGHIAVKTEGNVAGHTHRAYAELLEFAKHQQKNLVRIWNFVPDINIGDGDDENYRQFCLGRYNAFTERSIHSFPAASALGTLGDELHIYFLLSRHPVSHIENPKQVPAYEYPRQYGPASPSFARASVCDGLLFLSGTAAVVGHKSVSGNADAQLSVTLDNITQVTDVVPHRTRPVFARAYIRQGHTLAAPLQAHFDGAVISVVEANICRRDLHIEIEGIYLLDDRSLPSFMRFA